MSRAQFVAYRDHGFWAYDVAMGVLLKHLVDVAEARLAAIPDDWLREAVSSWRVVACVSDYGVSIDANWSEAQLSTLRDLIDAACTQLETRESIPKSEITRWSLLGDLHLHTRGAEQVRTGPVVELGRAIVSLIGGSLPEAPAGSYWIYGTPEGRVLHQPRGEGIGAAEQGDEADER